MLRFISRVSPALPYRALYFDGFFSVPIMILLVLSTLVIDVLIINTVIVRMQVISVDHKCASH
jgi:hypothetical protein